MTHPTEPIDPPSGALIEILEMHDGPERRPHTGHASILAPNYMRINGVGVFATQDHPAVLQELHLSGVGGPFTVEVQLMARALRVGATPTYVPAADDRDWRPQRGVVVEIPDVDEFTAVGEKVHGQYVLLNGYRLLTGGPVVVDRLVTDGPDRTVAVVTVPLLCRRLIVDDEPRLQVVDLPE